MKSFSRGVTVGYEILLRTIGQRLESQQVKSFTMEIRDKKVLVSGRIGFSGSKYVQSKERTSVKRRNAETIGTRISIDREVRRSHVSLRTFRDSYAAADINRLDQEGKARRRDEDRIPNSKSISQVLRAIGAYVSRKEGRLHSVAGRDGIIEIVYETVGGKQITDIFRWPT